jgi:hypothetical protein
VDQSASAAALSLIVITWGRIASLAHVAVKYAKPCWSSACSWFRVVAGVSDRMGKGTTYAALHDRLSASIFYVHPLKLSLLLFHAHREQNAAVPLSQGCLRLSAHCRPGAAHTGSLHRCAQLRAPFNEGRAGGAFCCVAKQTFWYAAVFS